jgi:hypothetical protein
MSRTIVGAEIGSPDPSCTVTTISAPFPKNSVSLLPLSCARAVSAHATMQAIPSTSRNRETRSREQAPPQRVARQRVIRVLTCFLARVKQRMRASTKLPRA